MPFNAQLNRDDLASPESFLQRFAFGEWGQAPVRVQTYFILGIVQEEYLIT